MAIDFIKTPGPEHERKPKIDFFRPDTNIDPYAPLEKQYQEERAKLEAEKAEFEASKAKQIEEEKVVEEKPKVIIRRKKGEQ